MPSGGVTGLFQPQQAVTSCRYRGGWNNDRMGSIILYSGRVDPIHGYPAVDSQKLSLVLNSCTLSGNVMVSGA